MRYSEGHVANRQKLRLFEEVEIFDDIVSCNIPRLIIAFLISGKYAKKTWRLCRVDG